MDDYYSMRLSNDTDRSDHVSFSSMGVVDLDTSIVPDVFGLRAFDSENPITRMFPRQFRNELRLLIPDSEIASELFHDIVITDLSATRSGKRPDSFPGMLAEDFVSYYA